MFGRWSATKKRTFVVERERARTIYDSVTVFDGILRRDSTADLLELPDGRRVTIHALPENIQSANGSRVVLFDAIDYPWLGMIVKDERTSTAASQVGFPRDSATAVVPDSVRLRWRALDEVRAAVYRGGHGRAMRIH